jgi:DNA polymerase-3 subunit alpha
MKEFVHLHVHSEYSLLDGYAATGAIANRAAELGMDSIALTDHGVMYGALEFYNNAKKANVKPIIGMEAYIAPGNRSEPTTRGAKNYFHLLLLAKNEVGYRNLVKLTTRAHLEGTGGRGMFSRPRIDRELLEQYHEGLVVTSSCIAGELIQSLQDRNPKKAREIAAYYRDLLDPENYYLELQLHDNTPELDELNDEIVRIASELHIPLVATADTHFVRREDLEAHKMIMAMGFNLTLKELCSKKYEMDETYHIMSGEDMWQRFKKYGTTPLENTRRIAELCNLKLDFGRVQLPEFEIPAGHDPASYLRFVCEEGLMRRSGGHPPEAYIKRLHYELDVINQTGFPDYMLIVWDYVKFARSRGIPCVPRGSAGASLVLYCLGITDVDPVQNKLLFERFLSPERLEMPDIDIDFADSKRHLVIDYIANKYGHDNTAQIITYGTLGAKAALRDVGRVLEIPLSDVDRVAKLIPSLPVGTTIAQAIERVGELKQIHDGDARLRELLTWAQKVEGRMKSVGTHACGLVVSRDPLENMVPLQRTRDESAVMAAFEGPTLAKIGLLKMDLLGLTNLSVVAEALEYIEQTTHQKLELTDIPLDDKRVFEALGRGETVNVFQLESAGMTRYLMQLRPTRVEDLYAMVALYRPGPLEQIPVYVQNKNNPRGISYIHPILKPILEDTYGVIVYQEQIMQLLQTVADYTLGQAYIVIKAISKKDKKLMAENESKFKDGCLRKGLTKDQADQLWELILPFAGYSFNRPHSTLYGLLSYQTAWLKVNYPTEYMAAVLKGAGGITEDITKAVNECRMRDVPVLPPNVNQSVLDFTIQQFHDPQDNQVRRGICFGLSAIKGIGAGPMEAVLKARETGGPFATLEEFCDRVDRNALNKRVVENLIKSGAMDGMPGTRHQKLAILEQALESGIKAQKNRETGQIDMFGGLVETGDTSISMIPLPPLQQTRELDKELIVWEKELLGVAFSANPAMQSLERINRTGIAALDQLGDTEFVEEVVGKLCVFAVMVTTTRRVTTKKGDAMLVATIEDLSGTTQELVAFPKSYEKYKDVLVPEALLRVVAKVERDRRGEGVSLLLESAEPLDTNLPAAQPGPEAIEMDLEELGTKPDAGVAIAAAMVAPPTAPVQPVSILRPRAKPAVANNGQHHANNGNGNGHHEPAQPPSQPTPPTTPSRMLRLYLHRSHDYETDVQLMQNLYDTLRIHIGDDQVVLHLNGGNTTVQLRMRHKVNASTSLMHALQQMLGAQAVVLE